MTDHALYPLNESIFIGFSYKALHQILCHWQNWPVSHITCSVMMVSDGKLIWWLWQASSGFSSPFKRSASWSNAAVIEMSCGWPLQNHSQKHHLLRITYEYLGIWGIQQG